METLVAKASLAITQMASSDFAVEVLMFFEIRLIEILEDKSQSFLKAI